MPPKVHLFNPENDIALAHGEANFTPPRAARRIRDAGAALPFWYADDDDRILCYGINARWLDGVREKFGIMADVFDHDTSNGFKPAPWGWSTAVRREFLNEGFAPSDLPDDDTLACQRELSHRRTASVIRDALARRLDFDIAPAAIEARDLSALRELIARRKAVIIKSPWSSSGRGLIDSRLYTTDEIIRRCDGIIRRQGCVMVEEAYDRICDFAMLFICENRSCRHVGYSLFTTDSNGNYTGNILADDNRLLAEISKNYPCERIEKVAIELEQVLSETIAPHYEGPLGIDMLVARGHTEEKPLLDASVEMNLRMTMGFVAHRFCKRYLAPESTGRFSVSPKKREAPSIPSAVIESNRLVAGSLDLVPDESPFFFRIDAVKHSR